jgi:asparagine synthase (glutamine-hydrolysing)
MPREIGERKLGQMLETLRRGTPMRAESSIHENLGIYVGWTVRKHSFADAMPLRDPSSGATLVFSGEEYSRLDTTDEPSHLIDRFVKGPDFPVNLNGRFHGVAIDLTRRAVTLFNDRFGLHRLYYHESKDAFYFAAEAKAILEVCPELRAVDNRGLGELIACGCVLEDRTIFKDVHLLPPASAWVFRNGAIERKGSYFQPREWEEQSVLEPDSYYQEIRAVFSRSLPRYFGGNERIGMSLTGGLDTRMIMASHKPSPGSLPCYSFGGMFRDCQDVRIARRVARACGQSHEVIEVGKDFLNRFSQYAERTVYGTDGCASVAHAADLFANERAAQVAPVRMTGNYGGEVLRRVRAFKPIEPAPGLFRPELLNSVRAARATYAGLLQGHPLSFAVFRQTPWHHYGLLALEQTQVSVRSPYLDNEFVRTVYRAPASALQTNDLCLKLIADGNPTLLRIRTDRGIGGGSSRALSAISSGFLEFTFKAEYAYDYGMPQWLAGIDHFFSALHFERIFLGRHKFKHYRVWYRDPLSKYVRGMLLDRRTLSRPYLQPKTLEEMVEGHLRGNRNYTSEIHQILTLELIHRLFIDSK